MCVVVYLASGTVSTLQHSEHWAGWTIQESSTQHSLGGAAATTNSVLSSTFNQSRHLLFPKSIKGESAGGIRVRGDGTRHSSYLLSMVITFNAPRSRRNEILAPHHHDTWSTAAGDDPGPSGNNPMTHANHSSDGSFLSPHQPESADAAPSSSSSSSLLQIRFQFSSGVYFNVCRQLWWHYVNTAGKISIFSFFFSSSKISLT